MCLLGVIKWIGERLEGLRVYQTFRMSELRLVASAARRPREGVST